LKRRLLEINDLRVAGALLSWDQATYMPMRGATARARQGAIVSRIAHQKSVAPELGKLLEELEPCAASLPYESNEASLVRVARRDFEKAIRVPSDYVARVSAFGATAYDAWKRARPANEFATMVPFLERAIELGREYAEFFAPYEHVAEALHWYFPRREEYLGHFLMVGKPSSAGWTAVGGATGWTVASTFLTPSGIDKTDRSGT
jgi:carboxypeptidase Taq